MSEAPKGLQEQAERQQEEQLQENIEFLQPTTTATPSTLNLPSTQAYQGVSPVSETSIPPQADKSALSTVFDSLVAPNHQIQLNQQEQQQQPAAAWGWASWSASLITTAVKSTVETLEKKVDVSAIKSTAEKLGTTVKNVTAESLDKVYGTLDPEFDAEKEKLRVIGDMSESNAKNYTDNSMVETSGDEETLINMQQLKNTASVATESVFQTIDKTFDIASDLLGNAVLNGYRLATSESAKLRESDILNQTVSAIKSRADEFKLKADEFRSQAEKTKLVAEVEKAGGKAVKDGLEVLEKLGMGVMEVMTEARKPAGSTKLGHDDESSKPKTIATPTLKSLFEDNTGNAHLQALEMLSNESSSRFSSALASSPELNTDSQFQSQLEEIEAAFDLDEVLENLEELELPEDNIEGISDQETEELALLLSSMGLQPNAGTNSSKQLQALVTGLKKNLSEVEMTWKSELKEIEDNDVEVRKIAEKTLEITKFEWIKAFSSFAEKSCEQLLRLAEIYLMQIAEMKMAKGAKEKVENKEDSKQMLSAIELAKNLKKAVILFLTETQYISLIYVAFVDKLETGAVDQGRDHVSCDEYSSWFESKKTTFKKTLYSDVGTTMEFIQDAMNSCWSILKLLAVQERLMLFTQKGGGKRKE